MITIKVDTSQVQNRFAELKRKLPKVMAATVNTLASQIKSSTIDEMKSKFKGGTSGWVLNSFAVKKATSSSPTATVFYNRGRHFMEIQVDGGTRPQKAADSLLINKGVMGSGDKYLPGKGAQLDQFGNISPGIRSKVLSYFQTYTGKNARNNRKGKTNRAGDQFFALKETKGKLHAGIYKRVSTGAQLSAAYRSAMGAKNQSRALKKALKSMNPRGTMMVMAFDRVKPYKPLIKFYENGNKIVSDNMAKVFNRIANIELGLS